MIELERHIEILLLSNDCVIVPGFGGFMAHHVDARYDEQENLFLPPQRTIGFNPQLTLNDSLLAQSYIEAYDISYPEALRRIEDEVRELRQHIECNGSYELYDLGIIRLNEYGKYEFEPCEAGILTPELYGLSSFIMKPIASSSVQTIPAAIDKPDKEVSPFDILMDSDEKEEEQERTIKLSTLRNIAVACITIIAFFFISSPINNSDLNSNEARINTDMLLRIMPRCENIEKAQLKLDVENKDSVEAVKNTMAESSDTISHSPYYTIVLCSRVTVKNANAYVEQLHRQGLMEARVTTQGNYTKVVLGRFLSEREASLEAIRIQKNTGISDCWVTKMKD